MGRTLNFGASSRLLQLKKSIVRPERPSKLSARVWKRNQQKTNTEKDALTELPVPTVPPYPIEYFEQNQKSLSHINVAFQFNEDSVPYSNVAGKELSRPSDDVSLAARGVHFLRKAKSDDDIRGSLKHNRHKSGGGSTDDSGVVFRSDDSWESSIDCSELRMCPSAQKEVKKNPSSVAVYANVNINRDKLKQHAKFPLVGNQTFPGRPVSQQLPDFLDSGQFSDRTDCWKNINIKQLRDHLTHTAHPPPVRASSMSSNVRQHIYVNRPFPPSIVQDCSNSLPNSGLVHPIKSGESLLVSRTCAEVPQVAPNMFRHKYEHVELAQEMARSCGRSKSVHGAVSKPNSVISELSSINTLGIPYKRPSLSVLTKQESCSSTAGTCSSVPSHTTRISTNKHNYVRKVPLSRLKDPAQQGGSFKSERQTTLYSVVYKRKLNSDALQSHGTKLLNKTTESPKSYSSIVPSTRKAVDVNPPNTSAQVGASSAEVRKSSACGEKPTGSLYEELIELRDSEQEDRDGRFSIEVRIDYSKGTKYKVERRPEKIVRENNITKMNNNTKDEVDGPVRKLNNTCVNNVKLAQFRRDEKNSLCGRLRNSSSLKGAKLCASASLLKCTWCCSGNVKRYVHQPGRIENYVPGYSSLSEKELRANPEVEYKIEAKDQDPPRGSSNHRYNPGRMQMTHALKESGYESDSSLVFRKQSERRPENRNVSELYRQIQRGGDVPLEGLRKAAPRKPKDPVIGSLPFPYLAGGLHGFPRAESPYKYETSEVNIHYKTPVRLEQKEHIPDEELARRQEEHMRRVYEQERRKKYLAELEDIERRRHTDNFTPLQKSPIPLNRYDDDLRGGREGRKVAKALFNFSAQNKRELSFNKGDVISVRRQIDKNWHEGELRGLVGIFPSNYVEIVAAETLKTYSRKPTEGQARALFAFQAQTAMEMSFSKGETLILTRRVDDNWYEGRAGQRRGIFPVSYVDVLVEPGDKGVSSAGSPLPRPALPSSTVLYNGVLPSIGGPTMTAVNTSSATTNATYSQQLSISTQQDAVPYRALYNYKPQNEDELELNEGDVVMVMEKCDDGWYVGTSRRTSLFGTFPGNYVERVA